jgi:hypothetical protein
VKAKPQKRHTTLVALHLPDSGDRFALPILIVLALFALLACGADVAYRRIRR